MKKLIFVISIMLAAPISSHAHERVVDHRSVSHNDVYRVWVPGHWTSERRPRWVPGHWKHIRRDRHIHYNCRWVPGHYNRRGIWIPGRHMRR